MEGKGKGNIRTRAVFHWYIVAHDGAARGRTCGFILSLLLLLLLLLGDRGREGKGRGSMLCCLPRDAVGFGCWQGWLLRLGGFSCFCAIAVGIPFSHLRTYVRAKETESSSLLLCPASRILGGVLGFVILTQGASL